MLIYDNVWFRQIAWICFSLIGITMVTSLLVIYPFDFSVIPSDSAADLVPKLVTGLLVFMGVFYAISAIVLTANLVRQIAGEAAG
jgi:hypothetical protein